MRRRSWFKRKTRGRIATRAGAVPRPSRGGRELPLLFCCCDIGMSKDQIRQGADVGGGAVQGGHEFELRDGELMGEGAGFDIGQGECRDARVSGAFGFFCVAVRALTSSSIVSCWLRGRE